MHILQMSTKQRNKLKDKLKDNNVSVIFNEMTDDEGRYVLNILLAPLVIDGTGKVSPYLADMHFMQKTNHSTVSQAVIQTMQSYEIAYNIVVVFDTDNARYMKKAYKTVLSGLFPDSIHVTCLAHIINLVGESFCKLFEDVNAMVKAFSQMFYMVGGRKMRYLNYLRQNFPSATMAPDPVATRWNSWFAGVQYHANHFHYYHGFVEEELGVCGKSAPHSLQFKNTLDQHNHFV
ncbi:UNVERIFIED_CONTAM: hypothetical protein FKN15_049446 [Acipenser sinensis]